MSENDDTVDGVKSGYSEGSVKEEINSLGKNLIGVFRAAWNRPERQKLQQEIEVGLTELGSTLRKEARAISDSPVSQRIKTDVTDLNSRVRSGEVEAKVRVELVNALKTINAEIEKVSAILAATEADQDVGSVDMTSAPDSNPVDPQEQSGSDAESLSTTQDVSLQPDEPAKEEV